MDAQDLQKIVEWYDRTKAEVHTFDGAERMVRFEAVQQAKRKYTQLMREE